MTLDLATVTLREALDGIDTRQWSVFEITRETLLRARATEPELHAYVEVFEELALKTSLYMDRARARFRERMPLTGAPIAVKDIFDLAGKPTKCGSALFAEAEVAVRDAEMVHRLRRDGANFIGKTVTQEFAAGVVSAPCRNPWDLDRIPGGSSGGSAAAVAMGTCLGALGSDTGGSIRIPASLTGTVGLKPTFGRLPLTGTYPLSPGQDTPGPIARSVADALMLYFVLINRATEIHQLDSYLTPFGKKPLTGVRLGVPGGFFAQNLQPGVTAAYQVSLRLLGDLGADLVEVEWAEASLARAVSAVINRVESSAVHHEHIRSEEASLIGADTRVRFEVGEILPEGTLERAQRAREVVRASIAKVYAAHRLDAIVVPSTPATAPLADGSPVSLPDGDEPVGLALTRLTMPWNATGQPAISIPCGFDELDLPVGLSIVGKPDDELGICRIAHHYEAATQWFATFARPEGTL